MSIVVTTTQTEGSFQSIRTCIQTKGYGTDTAPTIQNAMINSVYRRVIGMRRWPFLEQATNSTINAVVDQPDYALGVIPDLLHVDAVRADFDQDRYDLIYLSPPDLRSREHTDHVQGAPLHYTLYGQRLRVYPRPDRAYNFKIDYISDPADLVGDTDVPVIPPAYQDVLCWGAIAELCFRERDIDGYNMAKQEYLKILQDMMAEYGVRHRHSSDQVRSSGWYDSFEQGM